MTAAEQRTAVIAEATTWGAFPGRWPALLGEVWEVVRANGALTPNRNVMLYLDDVPNVEIGVEVAVPFGASGRVFCGRLPSGRAARTLHIGRYEDLGLAHEAIIAWCDRHGLDRAGPRWEVYGHWNETSPDQEVEIYYLLR